MFERCWRESLVVAVGVGEADAVTPDVLRRAAIVLNDGSGIALAARIGGDRFPANLNGSDFNPAILGLAAGKGWPVYFLGAKPGVAERAAAAMRQRYSALIVAGCRDGYWDPSQSGGVAAEGGIDRSVG